MPRLELYDTVVLKEDRSLYGVVDRTHYDNHDPLHDCLIIAHVQVDPEALASFVRSGVPPKDHVFIRLVDLTQGSVLAHEDQTELIDRMFALGDHVKRVDSPMLGTVVDFQETYVLQSVWKTCHLDDGRAGIVAPTDHPQRRPPHVCTDACPLPRLPNAPNALPCDLIPDVPGEELKKAVDLLDSDLIVRDDWVGMVEELEQCVILLLEDSSLVVVYNPEELYLPIPDFGKKPLVSLPEFDRDIPRPDVVVAQHGWSATIPFLPDAYYSGRLVITNSKNLKRGRWLRGRWHDGLKPQGRIIDIRSVEAITRWLLCNPFVKTAEHEIPPPHESCSLYENINSFPHRSELRRNKKLASFDHSRLPRDLEDRRRNNTTETLSRYKHRARTSTDILVGDQVKFRDQAGAAVKYQGIRTADNIVHGNFERISPSDIYGFDVNVLSVVCSSQSVAVRWQDGTITKQASRSLYKFATFESDLMPADIVVLREGLLQRPSSSMDKQDPNGWMPYNETSVLEQSYDLKPTKVGILQSVDPRERVAQVRWFANPSLRILAQGNILSRDSRLGPLEEEIEDVSLYEVLNFPALSQGLDDIVIIAPKSPSATGLGAVTRSVDYIGHEPGRSAISLIENKARLRTLRGAASGIVHSDSSFSPVEDSAYRSHSSLDWLGTIVGLETDGTVIVRLNLGELSKDVLIEHDQIIAFIDEDALSDDNLADDFDSMDLDETYSASGTELSDGPSPIAETITYEGGHRLDDDSDDGNWDDEDSDEEMLEDAVNTSIAHAGGDGTATIPDESEHQSDIVRSGINLDGSSSELSPQMDRGDGRPRSSSEQALQHPMISLSSSLAIEQPSSFAILERQPPIDQYQGATVIPGVSAAFTRRIVKEHKILATALPQGEIYVRTYESRLDLMRCLILGPVDTPFEFAPFVIDLHFTDKFPKEPPIAHFHSWTTGLGRINPNLYEEGKICLSLLGTWQGKSASESWTPQATILQLLISLQGLVFVRQPFYNEAGYEEARVDDAYPVESLRYNEKSFVMTRAFVKHALLNVIGGIEDILAWTYLPHGELPGLLSFVIKRAQNLIAKSESAKETKVAESVSATSSTPQDELIDGAGESHADLARVFLKPLSRGAMVMLKKTIMALQEISDQVKGANNLSNISLSR